MEHHDHERYTCALRQATHKYDLHNPPQPSRIESIDWLLGPVFTQGPVDTFIGIGKRERELVRVRAGLTPIDLEVEEEASASLGPLFSQTLRVLSYYIRAYSVCLPALSI